MSNFKLSDLYCDRLCTSITTEDTISAVKDRRRSDAHILTPRIESIYANEKKRTTVIKWATGETTKVKCHEDEDWDLEKGVMACITKYVLGNNCNYHNILNKYIKSVK